MIRTRVDVRVSAIPFINGASSPLHMGSPDIHRNAFVICASVTAKWLQTETMKIEGQ